jgi:hypothetical protein
MKIVRRGWVLALVLAAAVVGAAEKAKPAAPTKKAAEENKIAGVTIPRPTGEFLGLEISNNNFVLTFYDAKKKKKPIDVVRATLRWPVRYQPNDERLVLNPGSDGVSLTSARVIRPAPSYRLSIALFVEGNEDPIEFYNVSYP